MNEVNENLIGITPNLDLNFVKNIVVNNEGEIKLISPIKRRDTDAVLLSENSKLTSQDLIKLFDKEERLIGLEKTICECISLPSPVTYDELKDKFELMIKIFDKKNIADFSEIKTQVNNYFEELMFKNSLHPLGLSSLTLLSEKESLFRTSLFSAVMGMKLQNELGNLNLLKDVFYTGLFQDVGKFFLDDFKLFSSSIDTHPLISADVLSSGNFSSQIVDGVRSHEKYLNGTGFPKQVPLPNYLAQNIQVSNKFMKYFLKGGLEYSLGKLNSMAGSVSNDNKSISLTSLNIEIVKSLIDLYPQIDQSKFDFYLEYGYYESSFEFFLNKIKGETKLNLEKMINSSHFEDLNPNVQNLIKDSYKTVESCGNWLNCRLTQWAKNIRNVKIDSLKVSKKDELYPNFQKFNYLSQKLADISYDVFGDLEKTSKLFLLKFNEMEQKN